MQDLLKMRGSHTSLDMRRPRLPPFFGRCRVDLETLATKEFLGRLSPLSADRPFDSRARGTRSEDEAEWGNEYQSLSPYPVGAVGVVRAPALGLHKGDTLIATKKARTGR